MSASPSSPPPEPAAHPLAEPTPKKRISPGRTIIAMVSWLYLAIIVAVWLVLPVEGDRWGVATLGVFGPLWVFPLPLILLAPFAAGFLPRPLWVRAPCGFGVFVS